MAVAVASPSENPKQVASFAPEMEATSTVGSVIELVAVVVHPLASVVVTV